MGRQTPCHRQPFRALLLEVVVHVLGKNADIILDLFNEVGYVDDRLAGVLRSRRQKRERWIPASCVHAVKRIQTDGRDFIGIPNMGDAVRKAQDENRRKGVPNVYVINGTIVWQLPDGTITTTDPLRKPENGSTGDKTGSP